jgi:DNA repair protein RadC
MIGRKMGINGCSQMSEYRIFRLLLAFGQKGMEKMEMLKKIILAFFFSNSPMDKISQIIYKYINKKKTYGSVNDAGMRLLQKVQLLSGLLQLDFVGPFLLPLLRCC